MFHQLLNKLVINFDKYFKILPKWRNVVKSGHTDTIPTLLTVMESPNPKSSVTLPQESYDVATTSFCIFTVFKSCFEIYPFFTLHILYLQVSAGKMQVSILVWLFQKQTIRIKNNIPCISPLVCGRIGWLVYPNPDLKLWFRKTNHFNPFFEEKFDFCFEEDFTLKRHSNV